MGPHPQPSSPDTHFQGVCRKLLDRENEASVLPDPFPQPLHGSWVCTHNTDSHMPCVHDTRMFTFTSVSHTGAHTDTITAVQRWPPTASH